MDLLKQHIFQDVNLISRRWRTKKTNWITPADLGMQLRTKGCGLCGMYEPSYYYRHVHKCSKNPRLCSWLSKGLGSSLYRLYNGNACYKYDNSTHLMCILSTQSLLERNQESSYFHWCNLNIRVVFTQWTTTKNSPTVLVTLNSPLQLFHFRLFLIRGKWNLNNLLYLQPKVIQIQVCYQVCVFSKSKWIIIWAHATCYTEEITLKNHSWSLRAAWTFLYKGQRNTNLVVGENLRYINSGHFRQLLTFLNLDRRDGNQCKK